MNNFQEQRQQLQREIDNLELFNDTEADVSYWFSVKYKLPALHQWADGYEQGEATIEELELLAERGLIDRDDENESGFDFSQIDELYLHELEKALKDPGYNAQEFKKAHKAIS